VRVSSILEFYTQDFRARSPSSITYIDKYASKSLPGDYRIEFFDYEFSGCRFGRGGRGARSI